MSYSGKFKDKNNNLHPVTSVLYGTCDTAAATAAKVVTCSDFDTLMTGVTIRVKFDNANTAASPTVNINSTGAKSVYRFGSTAPVDGNSWNAGEVVELVYDGTSFFMAGADDLSVKQNATDNNLDTEAKTIVGAINENTGDISSLKSGLTNVESKIDDATEYPYADVITISDAVPANLADCNVKIEPVQDLHGYDKPWVGGASKNIIPMTVAGIKASNTTGTWTDNVYALNGVTFEILTDNDNNVIGGKLNGTNNSGSGFDIILYRGNLSSIMSIGETYTITDCSVSDYRTHNYSGTFTVDSDWNITDAMFKIWVGNSTTFNNEIRHPQLEVGNQATTFAPYTNICPISGHTEVDVQRDGKNLLNPAKFARKDPNSGDASNNWAIWEDYIRCDYNDSLTLNCGIGHVQIYRIIVSCFDKYMNRLGNISETYIYGDGYTFTINIAGTKYCMVQLYNGSSMADYDFSTAQLELGSSATDYVPYAGKTYTIALGSTIYGGTVDFDSGVMTVDRAVVDLGDFTWENDYAPDGMVRSTTGISGALNPPNNATKADMVSDRYMVLPYYVNGKEGVDSCSTNGALGIAAAFGNNIGIRDMNLANMTPSDIKTAVTGYKLLYKLATPTTIQLTPQQIQLLKGQNTITASTGQISVTVNGVSGAIGSVQEQVNELAEDVAEIEPVNYSTTEQKTGQKWIDGNDIYFKAIDIGALPNATNKDVLTNITNIRDVVKIDGIATNGTIYTGIPHGANIAQYGVEVSYDKTSNYVRVSTSEDQSSYTGVIIIYYTKTA